jgi:hypothetical protein
MEFNPAVLIHLQGLVPSQKSKKSHPTNPTKAIILAYRQCQRLLHIYIRNQ